MLLMRRAFVPWSFGREREREREREKERDRDRERERERERDRVAIHWRLRQRERSARWGGIVMGRGSSGMQRQREKRGESCFRALSGVADR